MMNYDFSSLTGEVITPNDSLYEEARQEWNRAIESFPIAIVYCYETCDVSNAICFSRKYNIGFRIRSGGHNYEGYSTGDGVIVIDISRMNKVKILEDKNIIKVQAGVENRKLYDFVASRGYPFPGGSCPTVRISGYTLGGGWGYSCRHFGLGCDSLLQVEMVDYKGEIIIANRHCNSDLFWALKGAGDGNFGIIVALIFKLPQKVNKVTLVEIYYGNCDKGKLVNIFNMLQKTIRTMDRRLTTRTGFYSAKNEGLASYTKGIFYGNEEEALEAIKSFTEIDGCEVNTLYGSFYEVIKDVQSGYPPSEKFKSSGRFVYKEYTIEEIENIIELIVTRPEDSIFAEIGVFALGGAVKDKCNKNTAYYYRDAKYILALQTIWLNNEYKKENVKWFDPRFEYLCSITEGSYVNFPYSQLIDYEKEYYGENRYRLRNIKSIYDPFNIFKYPQSIRI